MKSFLLKFRLHCAILAALALLPPSAFSQSSYESEEYRDSIEVYQPSENVAMIEEIDTEFPTDSLVLELPDYLPWKTASIQGKLKMKGLPLSPSVKIFLQYDSLIDLSFRAPLVGEAARIIISPDTVIAVNRLNQTYIKEEVSQYMKFYPDGISNFQDLLLARFFLPYHDVMEEDFEELIDIYYEDNQFNVVPKAEAEISGIKYGYVVDESFAPLMLVIIPDKRPDVEIAAIYSYNLNGYDLRLAFQENGNVRDLTLELKNPEYESEFPKELKIDKKYKKISLGEFINSFGKF